MARRGRLGVHLIAAGLLIAGLGPALAAKTRQVRAHEWIDAAQQCVMPVVILGLTLQGLWKSRHSRRSRIHADRR
jgi:hypothetical protein